MTEDSLLLLVETRPPSKYGSRLTYLTTVLALVQNTRDFDPDVRLSVVSNEGGVHHEG